MRTGDVADPAIRAEDWVAVPGRLETFELPHQAGSARAESPRRRGHPGGWAVSFGERPGGFAPM